MTSSQVKTDEISFLNAKKAVILNFTASTYHWGCYGTSMEIYHTLLEKGYYIETVDVNTTHQISPTIEKVGDFDNAEFMNRFAQNNVRLITTLRHCDVVVVNGEGTLHRLSKGALNLLYIMYICKKFLHKRVHLINFSCFPNGDASMPKGVSEIYPQVLRFIDHISPRDHLSNSILSNSGVETIQAFDCLPRFLNRYNLANSHNPSGYVLVSGGVFFDEKRYDFLLQFIRFFLEKNIPVKFLSGAHFLPAEEDIRLQHKLRAEANMSGMEVVQARSMLEWIETFQNASFLFSARFHHTIAALSIGTPFKYLSSNTPKINAIIETLGENIDGVHINESEIDYLQTSVLKAIKNNTSNKSIERIEKMLSYSDKNFIGIVS